jgi:hypothetical protein
MPSRQKITQNASNYRARLWLSALLLVLLDLVTLGLYSAANAC